MTAPARVSFYRAQMRAGNVQLLCSECNSMKGGMTRFDWETAVRIMFADHARRSPPVDPARGPAFFARQRRDTLSNILRVMWCRL